MNKDFYSNCLIEAIKAKIKYGNRVMIVHLTSKDGLHHFAWIDKYTNTLYDFMQIDSVKHWFQLLWFKGRIRKRKYKEVCK